MRERRAGVGSDRVAVLDARAAVPARHHHDPHRGASSSARAPGRARGRGPGGAGVGRRVALPPRTTRIFYDEQIYQSVGRSLAETGRAELCNEGDVEYGRLRCMQGQYNKEPNAYPYLLSVAYRIGGVSDLVGPRLNNIVAGLAVLVTFALGAVLFRDLRVAAASGVMLALMPMQIAWANTAAVEPSAALFSAAAVLSAAHYARTRTSTALAWAVALTVFAMSFRPESVLVVPIVLLVIALLAPAEFRTRRFWIGAGVAAVLAVLPLAHVFAVRNLSWDAPQARMSWSHLASNFPTNFWFYVIDERFPALFTFMALAACFMRGAVRERLLLIGTSWCSGACSSFFMRGATTTAPMFDIPCCRTCRLRSWPAQASRA